MVTLGALPARGPEKPWDFLDTAHEVNSALTQPQRCQGSRRLTRSKWTPANGPASSWLRGGREKQRPPRLVVRTCLVSPLGLWGNLIYDIG